MHCGIEFRSSCFQGTYFSNWAISSEPRVDIFVWKPCVLEGGAQKSHKRESDALELELQAADSHMMGSGSSGEQEALLTAKTSLHTSLQEQKS